MNVGLSQAWDGSYVADGCSGQPLQGSNVDDSWGTCILCFVVATIGLGALLAMARKHREDEQANLYWVLALNYFGWTSVAFAVAGLTHRLALVDPWSRGVSLPRDLASTALGLLGVELLTATFPRVQAFSMHLRLLVVFALCLAMLAAIFATHHVAIAGVFAGLVLTVMLGLWSYRTLYELPGAPAIKAVGAQVMIAGLAVHHLLDDTCGPGGYADCWVNCPLPGAPNFNHNSLSSLLFSLGLHMLGVAMYVCPDIAMEGISDYLMVSETSHMQSFEELTLEDAKHASLEEHATVTQKLSTADLGCKGCTRGGGCSFM